MRLFLLQSRFLVMLLFS
uniref:Uncharacterized protein n=1 Tax=Anguilla anguilla TaxID=7936 RepID=A0A0E9VSA2_ANGAN